MDKKIKKTLENDWGYKVESESPLKLVGTGKQYSPRKEVILTGIPAQILVNNVIDDMSDNGSSCDLSKLDGVDNDVKLLVTADVNYADEFNMSEWQTMSVGDFRSMAESLKEYEDEIEWYFGSNEELRFDDGNDLLGCLSFKIITEDEYDTLDELFGGAFDGGGKVFEHIYELGVSGGDEEEEEEGLFTRSELKQIEKLKLFGWDVKIVDEDENLVSYTNINGDYAVTDSYLVDELVTYHKKNK